MMPIRVLLVDDHSCVRAGLRSLLEDADDFEVVGESESCEGVLGLVMTCTPDVVILDVDTAPDGCFVLLDELAGRGYRGKVALLSLRDGAALRLKAQASGAGAFLDKGVAPEDLLQALRRLAGRVHAAALDDPPPPAERQTGAGLRRPRRAA